MSSSTSSFLIPSFLPHYAALRLGMNDLKTFVVEDGGGLGCRWLGSSIFDVLFCEAEGRGEEERSCMSHGWNGMDGMDGMERGRK